MTRLSRGGRSPAVVVSLALIAVALGAGSAALGVCGPFTDVSDDAFCPFVLEIFTLGITTGTTPTTYDPSGSVTRLQMAAFLSRSVDGALRRGSRRALIKKFWTPQTSGVLGTTTLGATADPFDVACDGKDIWTSGHDSARVWRVRASDGRLLENWTGAGNALGIVAAMGRILVAGALTPGRLYRIDPSQPAGAVTTVASNLGGGPNQAAFDGFRIWTTNFDGSISVVTPLGTLPWTVTTVTTGFSNPYGIVYDGSNIWVRGQGKLLKLDSNAAVLQTVTVGAGAAYPVFDGTNIWAPDYAANSVTVVRASSGAVLATLTGNGLDGMSAAAFDGERVLVTNSLGDSVSLWKAGDLTALGSFQTGGYPAGACSDGFNFWIATLDGQRLERF